MTYYDKKQRRKGMNHILGSHTHSLEVNRMARVFVKYDRDFGVKFTPKNYLPEQGERGFTQPLSRMDLADLIEDLQSILYNEMMKE